MSRFSIFAAVLAAQLLAEAGSAQATTFNATLSSIKVQGLPGQFVNRTFELTLDPKEKRTQFTAKVEDWWPSEDGHQSFYEPAGSHTRSCAAWVSVNPGEASVDPGKKLVVQLSIAVPADTKPGGYWAVLTVDQVADPLDAPKGVGVQFLASVSTGIFVNVEPVRREARITAVEVGPEQAKVTLQNQGDCPLSVEGRLEFLRPGEKTPVAQAQVARRTIVPEPISTGVLAAQLPDVATLPSGRYLVRVVLDIGLDHYIGVQRVMEIRREPTSKQAP